MNQVKSIVPNATGRAIIVGQSGSGKTVLARELIKGIKRLIVIDPKRMFTPLPGMTIYDNPDKLIRAKSTFCVYRPAPSLLDDMDSYDKIYKYAYLKGGLTVYTDEVSGVITETRFPKYLKIAYQMGREKGLRMISTTQRPARIPLFLISECSFFYTFRLVLKNDIKRMQECQPDFRPERLTQRFSFWYSDLDFGRSFPAKVAIK